MPYVSCLVSCSVVWRQFCSPTCPVDLCLMQLCLSEDLGFCSPFYLGCFVLHPGIACVGYVHYGIACLASQASDWAGAPWDGLSGLWLVTLCKVFIQAYLL